MYTNKLLITADGLYIWFVTSRLPGKVYMHMSGGPTFFWLTLVVIYPGKFTWN